MAIENLQEKIKKYNLQYPQNLNEKSKILWDDFLSILIFGIENEVIPEKEKEEFEKIFYQLPDNEKIYKNIRFAEIIQKKVEEKENLQEILWQDKFENEVENIKKKYPSILHPYIEYIFYSIATGQPIDSEIIKEFTQLSGMSEKQLKELQKIQIYSKVSKIKNDGFRLNKGKIEIPNQNRQFNTPLAKNQIQEIIQRSEVSRKKPIPANIQQQQRASRRNQASRINFQKNTQTPQNSINYSQNINPQRVRVQPPNYSKPRPSITQSKQQNIINLSFNNPNSTPTRINNSTQNTNTNYSHLPKVNHTLKIKQKPQQPEQNRVSRNKGLGDLLNNT